MGKKEKHKKSGKFGGKKGIAANAKEGKVGKSKVPKNKEKEAKDDAKAKDAGKINGEDMGKGDIKEDTEAAKKSGGGGGKMDMKREKTKNVKLDAKSTGKMGMEVDLEGPNGGSEEEEEEEEESGEDEEGEEDSKGGAGGKEGKGGGSKEKK